MIYHIQDWRIGPGSTVQRGPRPHISKMELANGEQRVWCMVSIDNYQVLARPPSQGGLWYIAQSMYVHYILGPKEAQGRLNGTPSAPRPAALVIIDGDNDPRVYTTNGVNVQVINRDRIPSFGTSAYVDVLAGCGFEDLVIEAKLEDTVKFTKCRPFDRRAVGR